jgi:glycerol-3-phosphate dehydrogenase
LKNEKGIIEGVEFRDRISGKTHRIKAKYVVNCTGAWADEVRKKDNPEVPKRICIVGGSHLTYQNKIGSPRFGLCLPSKDGRVVLVVPWLKRIIAGTTERKFD